MSRVPAVAEYRRREPVQFTLRLVFLPPEDDVIVRVSLRGRETTIDREKDSMILFSTNFNR